MLCLVLVSFVHAKIEALDACSMFPDSGVPAVVALAGRCLPFCSLQFPGVLASAAKLRFRFRFALVKLSLARGVEIAIATSRQLVPWEPHL